MGLGSKAGPGAKLGPMFCVLVGGKVSLIIRTKMAKHSTIKPAIMVAVVLCQNNTQATIIKLPITKKDNPFIV